MSGAVVCAFRPYASVGFWLGGRGGPFRRAARVARGAFRERSAHQDLARPPFAVWRARVSARWALASFAYYGRRVCSPSAAHSRQGWLLTGGSLALGVWLCLSRWQRLPHSILSNSWGRGRRWVGRIGVATWLLALLGCCLEGPPAAPPGRSAATRLLRSVFGIVVWLLLRCACLGLKGRGVSRRVGWSGGIRESVPNVTCQCRRGWLVAPRAAPNEVPVS